MAASSDQELEFEKQKSSSGTADNCPQITTSSTSQVETGHGDGFSARSIIKVTLLGSEWNSSEGGLSTLNRELAIYLSKHPKVEVTLLIPEGVCKDNEKREAGSYGITIVEAKEQTGYDPLDWLISPPKDLSIDVVIGHGKKLGRQVQGIRNCAEFKNCKWVQVVHTAPEDLGKFKDYINPTSKGERKHQVEVDLCKRADLVMPVGPRLTEFYSSYLQRYKKEMDVLSFTPGLFEREFGDLEQDANNNADFKVLIFGRGDKEDFELKGYNIAAKAFTDPRLEKKPYQLIFVGAPKEKEKQEEFKERLLQCGIAKEQLIVRTFIENRDSLKDLLCEVDLAIMPSKSEGFGLVALEALSAGLPILVGSRSGFAKALENVPNGYSCIVYSDDPAKWAKAIEAVRVRHGMQLREIKALKASYGEMYSWRKQCDVLVERMKKMIYGSSVEENKNPRTDAPTDDDRLVSERSPGSNSEKKVDAASGNQTEMSTNTDSQSQISRKRKRSGSFRDPDIVIKHSYRDLSNEQEQTVHDILSHHVQVFIKNRKVATPDGVSALIEHIHKTYNLALESVGVGSLELKFRCPTLDSLEHLWSDYQSGYLNEIAEKYLVTNEIKEKLNLDAVRLKTTIEDENYRNCRKILMEKSLLTSSSGFSPSTESDQEREDSLRIDTSSDVPKDKKQVLTHMERAEKAKASRGSLHKAAISGQYETVKMLLESGEDVDQRDQESVVKLLLEYGANVNAEDRFQHTPLQKAERHNHNSIVQLLMNSNARPSYQQPLSLRSLAENSFLHVDTRSGFNMLTAAVFEGNYDIALKAHALLENFVKEMNLSAVADILANLETKLNDHYAIERLYREMVYKVNTLTELHRCKWGNDSEKAVELVLNDGLDINTPALCNRTPLLWASPSSSGEFIETLIDLGADVNAQRTDDKVTPLILAACWNNYMAIHLLLERGGNALINTQKDIGHSPLVEAARHGFCNVAELLIEKGSNVNLRNKEGKTPLYFAVENKDEQLIRLLLKNKADVSMRYKDFNSTERISLVRGKDGGEPAWHYVLVNKHVLGLFLKKTQGGSLDVADFGAILRSGWGKDPPVGVTFDKIIHESDALLQEISGDTVLHISCMKKDQPDVIDLLVQSGADVNAQAVDGFTPLHIAAIYGNLRIVRKLVDLDADVNITTTNGKNAAEVAHLFEESEIEEYLDSKMASSQRTKGKEGDSELVDILIEAYGLQSAYNLTQHFKELNL